MRIDLLNVGAVETNCYIVSNEASGEAFVIDPGDDAGRISSFLQENKLSLCAILLTHGHFDHIMAVNELRCAESGRIGIPVYAGIKESELLSSPMLNCSLMVGNEYSVEADCLLEDGQTLNIAGFEIKVIHTPGHTRGAVCYYIPAEKCLFSGDTLFRESIGRTDLPTGNSHLLVESLRNRLAVLPEDTEVFPGHGERSAIGYEIRNNFYMRDGAYYE